LTTAAGATDPDLPDALRLWLNRSLAKTKVPSVTTAAPPALPVAPLVVEVLATVRRPVDAWAVAATLESFGLRDVDAGRYGEADIFVLAKRVYDACRAELRDQPDPRPALPRATARKAWAGSCISTFAGHCSRCRWWCRH